MSDKDLPLDRIESALRRSAMWFVEDPGHKKLGVECRQLADVVAEALKPSTRDAAVDFIMGKGVPDALLDANELAKRREESTVKIDFASGQSVICSPDLMPGWGCNKCRAYNGILRLACKMCGENFLFSEEEMGKFIEVVRAKPAIPLPMLLDIIKASNAAKAPVSATDLFDELLRRCSGSTVEPSTAVNVVAAVAATICLVYSNSAEADFIEICRAQWQDRSKVPAHEPHLKVVKEGDEGGGKTH